MQKYVGFRKVIAPVSFIIPVLFFFCSTLFCQGQELAVPEIKIRIGTFLGNEKRNYYGNEAPDELNIIWKHYLGKGITVISRKIGEKIWAGAGWTGQPLIVEEDGRLFLIQGAYDHNLKKISADSGNLVWQYKFDDVVKGTGTIWENPYDKNPATRYIILQGSRLGVGNYLDTRQIPSFRAINYMTGKEEWRLDVKWTDSYSRDADGSPLIINDTVYTGLENSLFTVLDPDPAKVVLKDGMLQPCIIQERLLYKQEDVFAHKYNVVTESSPARLGNHIYITSGSGHVWGYNLKSRELDWDFKTGSDLDGSAVVTSDSCLLITVEKQYIPGHGGAFKLDPSKDPDSCVIWYYPVADSIFSSWAGGIIGSTGISDSYPVDSVLPYAAFIGIDGYLCVVSHQETEKGIRALGPDSLSLYPCPKLIYKKYIGPSISTPVFVGDKLIAASYYGLWLFQFDKKNTFALIDRFSGTFEATPVAWNGKIYLASREGYLYCFGSE
jgi:outer membrane protein assembly factor BamB